MELSYSECEPIQNQEIVSSSRRPRRLPSPPQPRPDKPLFLLSDEGPVTRSNPGAVAQGFNAMLIYGSDRPPPAP